MNRRKKILLIMPLTTTNWGTKNAGGVDSVCQMFVEYLVSNVSDEFQYRVLAIDPLKNHGYTGEVIRLSESVELVWIPITKNVFRGRDVPSILYLSVKIRNLCKLYQPDVVHSHIWSWLLNLPKAIPSIVTAHSYKWIARAKHSWLNDLLYVKVLPNITKSYGKEIVCVGSEIQKAIENDLNRSVKVIGNPIDEEYFIENIRSANNKQIKIVTCALLTPRKQIEKIIDLVQMLLEINIDVELNIIGPASDYSYFVKLQEQVKLLNIEDKVYFLGALSKLDIIEQYKMSDLAVFLSKEETFGLAPLEMMATGLPLLSTKVGVLAEKESLFLELGAVFVDVSEPEQMLQLAIKQITHPVFPDVKKLKKEFSVSAVVEQYEEIFRGLS